MADDFNPDTIPGVLSRDVLRVTADGRPTAHLLNWESSLQAWMKKNTTDLRTKITTVRDESQNGLAEVNNRVDAVVDEQGALAQEITDLTAEFGDFSANGSIQFKAMAGPTGAIAAYGIFLTAGDVYTGMQLVAYSGGLSAVVFDANYFQLNNSGTGQNVFSFDGSIFTFNVPVRVRTGDILDGAVSSTVAATGNPSASVTVNDVTAGARVRIMAIYEGDTTPRTSVALFTVRLYQGGTLVKTVPLSVASSGSGTSTVTSYLNTTMGYVATLAAGNHTFSVDCVVAVGLDPGITKNFYIEATVLKR